jgi:hypothetical protein
MPKTGTWTPNEIFYLVNHMDILTEKVGYETALERTAYLLNCSTEKIRKKYEVEKQKNRHRAG